MGESDKVLRELVTKWRDRATPAQCQEWEMVDAMADELEAALASREGGVGDGDLAYWREVAERRQKRIVELLQEKLSAVPRPPKEGV